MNAPDEEARLLCIHCRQYIKETPSGWVHVVPEPRTRSGEICTNPEFDPIMKAIIDNLNSDETKPAK